MHIGIVLSQPPAYSETFFTSKIKGLQEAGFAVTLFVQKNNSAFTLCPTRVAPKVYRFAAFQLVATLWVFISLLPYIKTVLRYRKLEQKERISVPLLLKKIYLNAHLLKANPDWLHFGFTTLAINSETVAKAIGAKMAVSFRGFDINIYPLKNKNCYQKVWLHVDKVHSISKYLLSTGHRLGLSPETPHQIITPAIDLSALPEIKQPNNATLKIVTIARFNWIKGLSTAIAAMELLKNKNLDFEYHIVGDGSTKERERYTFQVHESQLSKQVFFHGKMTHKKTLAVLQEATVYVQPSINEGFCNAVLEAQALGKMVVASNVGGLPENVIDEKTGWLFPVEDAAALAATIQNIVAMSDDEKQKVSEHARKRVHDAFSIQQQQQQFVSFYTSAL